MPCHWIWFFTELISELFLTKVLWVWLSIKWLRLLDLWKQSFKQNILPSIQGWILLKWKLTTNNLWLKLGLLYPHFCWSYAKIVLISNFVTNMGINCNIEKSENPCEYDKCFFVFFWFANWGWVKGELTQL